MRYLRALKFSLKAIKHPLGTLLSFAILKPPWSVDLTSGITLTVKDLHDFMVQMIRASMQVHNNAFLFSTKMKTYYVKGAGSYETLLSTFVFEDWKWLPVKGKNVLDIGGYIGDTALYFLARKAKLILVYEPFPYSYRIAMQNIIDNGLQEEIKIVNAAVGGSETSMLIDPNYQNTNTSLAEPQEKGVEIKVLSLEYIANEHKTDDWVLKINCEGCEYGIFEKTSINTLRKFSHIQMHYHGNPSPLIDKLEDAGFKVRLGDFIYARRKNKFSLK
ncbi:MAG: FkbM family methyltransferase [Candidatus Parvarchaeota archaeon]